MPRLRPFSQEYEMDVNAAFAGWTLLVLVIGIGLGYVVGYEDRLTFKKRK